MKSELMEKWEEVTLGDVGRFLRGPFGSAIKKSVCLKKGDGIYKLYEQGNVIRNDFERGEYYLDEKRFNQLKKFEITSGDILITCAGTLGKIALVPKNIEKGIINSVLMRIRLDILQIDPKYFIYFFRSSVIQNMISVHSQGVAIKNLFATKELRNFKFLLPPLPTQQKIVSIIENMENVKEMRTEANELTNIFLKTTFVEMFDNDKFPTQKLDQLCSKISSGSTPLGGSKNYSKDGEILFIRSQNVLMNKFSDHDNLYISNEIHKKMSRTWVKKYDVLLNITGASIGRTALYLGEDDKTNVNQHVCIIRIKDFEKLDPTYLNYYLSSNKIQGYIQSINAGGTREALNFRQIKNFDIPTPPISFQQKFAFIVRDIENTKENQKLSQKYIENLFNDLKQKAFKGELVC